MSYWVAVVARNAAGTLRTTLDSILNQTIPPKRVVVVDDGSTDETGRILSACERTNSGLVEVLTQPDRGYDIRRVPANINLASRTAEAELSTDFFMISGDDCTYPKKYTETLIRRMNTEPEVVVTSGRPSSGGVTSQEHVPSGSGRMVDCSYWREVGGCYPVRAGWETWLLYKALEKGFTVKLFRDLDYEHLRPRGSMHQFTYWGSAMYGLGYHPLYALGRLAKNLVKMKITYAGGVNMLGGYLLAFLGSSDPFISTFEQPLRDFVHAQQASRIASTASTLRRRLIGQIHI